MTAEFAALYPFTGLNPMAMPLEGCICVLQFTLVVEVRRFQRRFYRITLMVIPSY